MVRASQSDIGNVPTGQFEFRGSYADLLLQLDRELVLHFGDRTGDEGTPNAPFKAGDGILGEIQLESSDSSDLFVRDGDEFRVTFYNNRERITQAFVVRAHISMRFGTVGFNKFDPGSRAFDVAIPKFIDARGKTADIVALEIYNQFAGSSFARDWNLVATEFLPAPRDFKVKIGDDETVIMPWRRGIELSDVLTSTLGPLAKGQRDPYYGVTVLGEDKVSGYFAVSRTRGIYLGESGARFERMPVVPGDLIRITAEPIRLLRAGEATPQTVSPPAP